MCVFFKFTLVLRLRLIKEKANEANLLTASVCMCCCFLCLCCVYIICFAFNNFLICLCVSFATIRFTREVFNWNYIIPSNRSLDGFFSVYFFKLECLLTCAQGLLRKTSLHLTGFVRICVCLCMNPSCMVGILFVDFLSICWLCLLLFCLFLTNLTLQRLALITIIWL